MTVLPCVIAKTALTKTSISYQALLRKVHVPCALSTKFLRTHCYASLTPITGTCMESPSFLQTCSGHKFHTSVHHKRMTPLSKLSASLVPPHGQLQQEISTNFMLSSICAIHTSASHLAKLPPVKLPALKFLKDHRENLKSAPMPAVVLGFSGLVPFVLPAVYAVATMSCSANVAYAQVAYGATILSFLGGIRWGLSLTGTDTAKPNWINLGYSVTPSIIAWMGLLMPLQPSVVCVASGLLFAAFVDSRLKGYPAWFKSLRFYLSTFAIISLLITYVYSIFFPTEEPESGYNWYKLVKIVQIILED